MRIQAMNYATGAFETVRPFASSATRLATGPDLYGWSANGIVLADRFWSPGGCESSGMANLRVVEVQTDGSLYELATFDASGEACLNQHLADGEHPATAGSACKLEDERVVLFTPPQCPFPAAVDTTPAISTLRLTQDTQAWQVTSGGSDRTVSVPRTATVTATAMGRDPQSATTVVAIAGTARVVCRSTTGLITVRHDSLLTHSAVRTLSPTVRAEIGQDVSRTWNLATFAATACTGGATFINADFALTARTTPGVGPVIVSPTLRFSI